MSEQIEVGDLVMVVRGSPCGCSNSHIHNGKIFRVTKIKNIPGAMCGFCRHVIDGEYVACLGYKDIYFRLERLKKIDAPPIAQDVETREELHA